MTNISGISRLKFSALIDMGDSGYSPYTLQVLSSQTPWIKQAPRWQLRPMKKQWGSCSPKGVLSLNPLLVKAPRECIDYVIVHELCHLKEHNHSKNFYKLLSQALQEWQSAKTRLDSMSELLLAD